MFILNSKEQEYLLHAIEGAPSLRALRDFYLWSQGALQALLPHRVLLCLHLDETGRAVGAECLHSAVLEAAQRKQLCEPDGPGSAWLRQWRAAGGQPWAFDSGEHGHALVHGSGTLSGGGSCFILLGLPQAASERQAWLLQLLLPCLHLALQRIGKAGAAPPVASAMVSPRQAEILQWLKEGKSNEEIGQLLGISSLTVKNHLQRLYRQLGVNNRTHAVVRSAALDYD